MALASCSIPGKLQCTGVAQGCTQIAINDRKVTGVSDSFSPTVHVLEYTGVNMAVTLLLQGVFAIIFGKKTPLMYARCTAGSQIR